MRLAIVVVILTIPTVAHAQMVVTDPQNLAQSIQQVLQQAEHIANTVKLVEAQAKHLAKLPEQARGNFDRLSQIRDVLRSVEGLSFEMERVGRDYERLYGSEAAGDLANKLASWRHATREATRTAMIAQGILGGQERLSLGLQRLVAASRAAPGSLAATQAANEIAAAQAASLMRLAELNATFQRAVMAAEAERQSKERAGRRRLERQVESLELLRGL